MGQVSRMLCHCCLTSSACLGAQCPQTLHPLRLLADGDKQAILLQADVERRSQVFEGVGKLMRNLQPHRMGINTD